MATYKYQQNMFDGASEGYVKYNITPDLGTVVSAGTTITITGQAYHKNRANKSIEIITIASNTYRSAFVNVNIPKATVTSFTLKFQMWELSSAWGTSRIVNAPINFTLWSGANCDGNGDGTFNTNSQAISYLTYRISPAAKTVQFERYALSGSTYVKNDEGTKVMGKLAISLAEGRTVSDITTAKVVVASDAGTSQTITLSTAVLNAALTSNGYVESSPSLFSSITFNTAYNYTLTFTIGDACDQAVFSVLVARAFANLHLSGLKTGGVAFGRFSSATLNNPKFESDFPAYLYGGVKEIGMNWVTLTPASGVTTPNSNYYGGGALRVAKIGGHVIILGSVLAKSGATLSTLPSGYYPTDGNRYKLVACGGSRVARIYVNTTGVFRLEWVRNLSKPKLLPYGMEDEDEAKIVKRIFQMLMAGRGRKPIVETLNAEGVPSPRDVKWAVCDIRRITKEAAYRDTIIDADTFDAAQNEMSERSKAYHYRDPFEGMFAGIITCGVCGRSFSRRDRGTSTLWLCRNYIKKGPTGCSSKGIRERLLKEIVSSTLGEGGLEDVDRVDNITVYPDGRLIVTVDDEEIEKTWR